MHPEVVERLQSECRHLDNQDQVTKETIRDMRLGRSK